MADELGAGSPRKRSDESPRQNNSSGSRLAQQRLRKTVFIVPSLLTTANIFCGFYSVMESMGAAQHLVLGRIADATEHFDRAAVNIGFAVLFDFLDGRIARMTRATSEFGLELDSIADVLSFGIAPAVLAYSWGYGQSQYLNKFGWAVSFLFVICGALRLARYNVQARQTNPNLPMKNPKADRRGFVGMPIPAGAGLIAAIAHFAPMPVAHVTVRHVSILGLSLSIDATVFSTALIALVALLAFLMVSTIRYSSFKGGTGNYHPRVLIIAIALIVLAIWFYSRWSLLILSIFYVTHGLAGRLWSAIKPRQPEATQS